MLTTKQRLLRVAGSYLTVFSGAAVVTLRPSDPQFITELINALWAGFIGAIPHLIIWCNDLGKTRK